MKDFEEIAVQYLYDGAGNKIGVFMNIKTFEDLIEQIEDSYLGMRAQKNWKLKQSLLVKKK